jgi:hypothetical protein
MSQCWIWVVEKSSLFGRLILVILVLDFTFPGDLSADLAGYWSQPIMAASLLQPGWTIKLLLLN